MEGPTMVGVLDRLVERDLVERRVAAHDRRANTVHLTDAGTKMLGLAEVELHKLRDVLLADLNGQDMEICIRVLGHVSAEARAFEPELTAAAES
jgi:MarR family transcriptional regulator for hemolysin